MTAKYVNSKEIYYLALLFICTVPWAIFQINVTVPGDAAFLFSGAKMLLEGKKMSEFFYDNNPPMSFLIYVPAVLLNLLGISKHMALQIYIMSFSLISVIATYYFLGKWKTLETTAKFIFLSCYIGAITLLCYMEYGQKDHFITIALIPFLLMQISITKKHNIPAYVYWIIAFLYVPFILIKPHFGILPTCIILHRLYVNRNLTSIIKADFIALAIGVISYIAFIFIVTPDFIYDILPFSIEYYVKGMGHHKDFYRNTISMVIFTSCLVFISHMNTDKTETKEIALIFSIMAVLSVIAFFAQNKGYSIHLRPILCFIFISSSINIFIYMSGKKLKLLTSPSIYILLIFTLSYVYSLFGTPTTNVKEIQNMSFVTLIKEESREEPFFIEVYTTNISAQTAFYTGNKFASRFPSLWFLSGLSKVDEDKQQAAWDRFSEMITEDFKYYLPKVAVFIENEEDGYSILSVLKNNADFHSFFKDNYQYKRDYLLLKSEYSSFMFKDDPDEIIYNVYIRKD